MTPQATFQRLLAERPEIVRQQLAAEDDGSFNRALDLLDQKEANRRMDNSPLLTGASPVKAERGYKGIRI